MFSLPSHMAGMLPFLLLLLLLLSPVQPFSPVHRSVLDKSADADSCPDGFQLQSWPDKKCVRYMDTVNTFWGAELDCIKLGGHLVSISDMDDNSILGSLLPSLETTVWIGLTNQLQTGNWTWTNGNPLEFAAWTMEAQRGHLPFNCTAYNDQDWMPTDCAIRLPYVCGAEPRTVDTGDDDPCVVKVQNGDLPCHCTACQPAMERLICPYGWTHNFNTSSCYKVFFNATADGAESICINNRASLASVHNDQENAFIAELAMTGLPQYQSNQVWLGVWRNNRTGDFYNGDLAIYDFPWAAGQPDNYGGNENCVELYADEVPGVPGSQGKWNDCPCSDLMRAFVCKMAVLQ